MTTPPKPPQFWDQKIATVSTAIDQCMKMGAVVIEPKKKTGFSEHR